MHADESLADYNNTGLSLLDTRSLHSSETSLIGFVNPGNLVFAFLQLGNQLGCVESAVASGCLDDFGLFLERKVLPTEFWSHNLLEKRKNLVMRNGAWIGKVIHAGFTMLCENDGSWQKVMKDSVAVGDVDHAVVANNLGHEIAMVEVIANRHAKAKDETVGITTQDLDKVLVPSHLLLTV